MYAACPSNVLKLPIVTDLANLGQPVSYSIILYAFNLNENPGTTSLSKDSRLLRIVFFFFFFQKQPAAKAETFKIFGSYIKSNAQCGRGTTLPGIHSRLLDNEVSFSEATCSQNLAIERLYHLQKKIWPYIWIFRFLLYWKIMCWQVGRRGTRSSHEISKFINLIMVIALQIS